MGIGLSISRTIVESHGGHIWAEPGPDGGMRFRFTLPAVREEELQPNE
jgi:two-component system sensor kinase FixL